MIWKWQTLSTSVILTKRRYCLGFFLCVIECMRPSSRWHLLLRSRERGSFYCMPAIYWNKKSDKEISGFDIFFIVNQIMLDWFNLSIHLWFDIDIYGNSLWKMLLQQRMQLIFPSQAILYTIKPSPIVHLWFALVIWSTYFVFPSQKKKHLLFF